MAMPKVTIDLSEAQSRTPLDPGTYPAQVKAFEGPTKGPKSSYLTAIIEITEGQYENRQIYHNLPITGKGAGIFADFVSKLTGQEIDVDELENLDIDTDDLVGLPFGIVTKQREYPEGSGEMQTEISKILRNK
jgi:hypothetical protein